MIYLDHAAATPMHPDVLRAMHPFFSDKFFNPSANYSPSLKVASELKQSRTLVAGVLGVKSSEIIYTAGGTEANNLAVMGIASRHPKSEIVSTQIEHESILEPLKFLKNQGHKVNLVKPKLDGVVDPMTIVGAVTEKTVLVSVIYANNEIGTIQPLRQISQGLVKIRAERLKNGNFLPLYLHTDACQAGNYLSLNVNRLGIDLMTLNGGKIYGPKQSGALYISAKVEIEPLIRGGGQERGYRSGTENVAAIVGFTKALQIAQSNRTIQGNRLKRLQEEFIKLLGKYVPNAVINGSLKHRLPNNLNVSFPNRDNERLQIKLDQMGIYCGLGSACSALKGTPSHVLKAIGLSESQSRSSLRFSMGNATSQLEIKRVVKAISSLMAQSATT